MVTKVLKRQPGTVDPEEYNWREQFAELDTLRPFTMVDTGKVIGLALALDEALKELAELRSNAVLSGGPKGPSDSNT